MNITTPRIPIRLPINTIVSVRSGCVGARNTASIAPTTIIGMPMPIEICFEAIRYAPIKNLYEFYEILDSNAI